MTVHTIITDLFIDVMMEVAKLLLLSVIYVLTLVVHTVANQVSVFLTLLNVTLKMDAQLRCLTAAIIMACAWRLVLTVGTQHRSSKEWPYLLLHHSSVFVWTRG